jgi:hypothetical protein
MVSTDATSLKADEEPANLPFSRLSKQFVSLPIRRAE